MSRYMTIKYNYIYIYIYIYVCVCVCVISRVQLLMLMQGEKRIDPGHCALVICSDIAAQQNCTSDRMKKRKIIIIVLLMQSPICTFKKQLTMSMHKHLTQRAMCKKRTSRHFSVLLLESVCFEYVTQCSNI